MVKITVSLSEENINFLNKQTALDKEDWRSRSHLVDTIIKQYREAKCKKK